LEDSDIETLRTALAGLERLKMGLNRYLWLIAAFVAVLFAVILPILVAAQGSVLDAEARGLPEEERFRVALESLRTVIFIDIPVESAFVVVTLLIYFRNIVPGLGMLRTWRSELRVPRLLIAFSATASGALSLVSASLIPVYTLYIPVLPPGDLIMEVVKGFRFRISAFPGLEVFGVLPAIHIVSRLLEFVGLAGYAGICSVLGQALEDGRYEWAGSLFALSIILGVLILLGVEWLTPTVSVMQLTALTLLHSAVSKSAEALAIEVANAVMTGRT